MIRPASEPRRYRIVIRGECGRLLASLLENAEVVWSQNGHTYVVVPVRDDPEFWGVLEQLRDLAMHVVSIQDLDHGNGQAVAS